ncbi:hypothetical protein GCM10009574_084810 [Streptomyces asiaticus]|uniref:Uncharacterized protein n=1 Tax=Streptomyces rhizosphaericus TaxID=114699 RepID=A0ABP4D3E3_9ACTN
MFEVQARRQFTVPQRQHDLQQADDARGALQVSHVRLRRTDQQGAVRGTARPVHRAERRGLHRIAHRGPGPVQLDVLDLGRVDARTPAGRLEHRPLPFGVGGGQAVAGAVVANRAPLDDAVDLIPVRQRACQGLEQDHPRTLATHIPIGTLIEGEAAAVRGQGAEPGRGLRAVRDQIELHTTGERRGRLPAPQALARQVHRHQRRRLPGVHHQARPPKSQDVGQPIRGHAAVQAGQGVMTDRRRSPEPVQCAVVIRGHPDEHPGVAAA